MTTQYPVFITVRDRVTCLAALVQWLESAGQERIYLLDNDSTYPPLLDYLAASPHTVVRLGANVGHRAAWESGAIAAVCGDREHFVVTDPDVVPVEECPADALDVFREILDLIPDCSKAGFGLRIDDLPVGFTFRNDVVAWESRFWTNELAPGIYAAPIDTTFALHRPGTPYQLTGAVRTGMPYVARHLGWYVDSGDPSDEDAYYQAHARRDSTHWSKPSLPAWYRDQRRAERRAVARAG